MRALLRDTTGATAAEFGLTLPVLLLFLFAIIDGGRYLWEVNRLEKAMQVGARYAVVTSPVASGLSGVTFVSLSNGSGSFLTQGDRIPVGAFGNVTCNDAACNCTAAGVTMTCTHDSTAFTAMVDRMQLMQPQIQDGQVEIEYRSSGLGFAGDPNGMDVAPLVTVRLRSDVARPTFTFLTGLMLASTQLPAVSSTLTIEDGQGTNSN
jgi:Flp pilus assembly protein TadG